MSHFWHFNDHKARSKHETYITDPVLPIYSLRSIRWYISLLHFKTFKVQFNAPPVLFPIRYQYGLNPINYWLELSIFPNSGERKSEKLGSCIKPRLYFQITCNSLKSWEIEIFLTDFIIFQIVGTVFHTQYVCRRQKEEPVEK